MGSFTKTKYMVLDYSYTPFPQFIMMTLAFVIVAF